MPLSPPTALGGSALITSHHLKQETHGTQSMGFCFFSFTFFFFPQLPTPNPLINAFKPTHCAGWVCLFISHHSNTRDPWNAVHGLEDNYQPKSKKCFDSVFFRVNPWQMLLLLLMPLLPLPWQMLLLLSLPSHLLMFNFCGRLE